MALIGYSLGIHDNKSYMNPEMWGKNICDCLDFVKNRHLHLNLNFKLKTRRHDISVTADSFIIVSTRFRDFCVENSYEGVTFYDLANYKDRFYMQFSNVVAYDTQRMGLQLIDFNPACNEYNEIVGAYPVILTNRVPLQRGFYRTDLDGATPSHHWNW